MRPDFIRSILLSGVAVAATVTAMPALAQAEDEGVSGDIIVTARRTEERLQDVPISITVMDQQQLTNRNITIANDLATYTPSLSSNERYGPEKQSFSLRGFNQDASTAPTVGVYFAEVVGTRAQGGTTSGNSVGAGAFMDLQNVQVLKGPQGTLFGRNTTGGAILLTPPKPTDNLEGYVEGSIGNYDMWRVQGAINLPLSDTFKVRFAADRMKRDGYIINKSGIAGTAPDYNDRNYQAYRLSILAELTPDLENYTIASYSKSNTRGYASRITACASPNTVPGSLGYSGTRHITALACQEQLARQNARGDGPYDVESSILNPYLKIEQWQVINTTTWRASDNLTIKNIASYGEFREQTHFDLYSSNLRVPAGGFNLANISPQLPFTAAAGTPFKYIELDLTSPGAFNSIQSTLTEELQLQGNVGDRLNYVVGGYLEFSRPLGNSSGRTGIYMNCTSPQDLACANPLFFGSISESRTQLSFNNHGVFGQATYKFTDQLSLTGGLRYTFDNIFGYTTSTRMSFDPANRTGASFIDPISGLRIARQCTDSFRLGNGYIADGNINRCRTDLTNKSNKATWTIGVDYKPMEDLLLYGKWSRGYRQGGINFTNPGLEKWGPEGLDTFEIGTKTSFRGAVNGYLNVAGFYNKLRGMQIFAGLTASTQYPGVAGGAAIVNAGSARSYGVEVDASAAVLDNLLRFDLGYAYLNTKITEVASQAELNALTVGTPFDVNFGGGLRLTATANSPFTLSPKHKLTLTGTVNLPVPDTIGKLSVGATLTYTAEQIANGSVPAYFTPLGGGILPERTLINMNVNWNNVGGLPVDASFFVTNLTKKVYAVNTGGGWNSSGIADMLMGEPRMWGFRLKYSFGN